MTYPSQQRVIKICEDFNLKYNVGQKVKFALRGEIIFTTTKSRAYIIESNGFSSACVDVIGEHKVWPLSLISAVSDEWPLYAESVFRSGDHTIQSYGGDTPSSTESGNEEAAPFSSGGGGNFGGGGASSSWSDSDSSSSSSDSSSSSSSSSSD